MGQSIKAVERFFRSSQKYLKHENSVESLNRKTGIADQEELELKSIYQNSFQIPYTEYDIITITIDHDISETRKVINDMFQFGKNYIIDIDIVSIGESEYKWLKELQYYGQIRSIKEIK